LQPDAMTRLGLDSVRLGEGIALPRPDPDAKLRTTDRHDRARFEPGFEPLYRRSSRPAIELGSLRVEALRSAHGELYRLELQGVGELSVMTAGDELVPWTVDPDDPTTVYIAPGADGACSVRGSDGSGVVVVHERGKGSFVYGFRPRTGIRPRPAALLPIASPAPDWLTPEDPDWLAVLVRSRAVRRGPYAATVATGIWHRLHEPSADARDAALAALLQGDQDELLGRASTWFGGLDADVRRAVAEGALAHVHALAESHAVLRAEIDLESPHWRDALIAGLHLRDDLASAAVLLRGHGECFAVDAALEPIDAAMARLVRSMPRPLALYDERLLRVGSIDPSAWWGLPLARS
jgi:hypothetical protein